MPDCEPEAVPALETVRAAFASIITRIVQYFQNGPHKNATVEEIAAGVGIDNSAERETIYSALDPYSEFAEKRNPDKPLLFRRVSPGEYEFLGCEGDPLDLTSNARIKDPLLREAYVFFREIVDGRGQGAKFQALPLSKRVTIFQNSMAQNPEILSVAHSRLKINQESEELSKDLF